MRSDSRAWGAISILTLALLALTAGGAADTAAGSFAVVYSFCSQTACADGAGPAAGLVSDKAGNLYGTTASGGAHGGGAIFELSPQTGSPGFTYQVLYSFCTETNCTDGSTSDAPLIVDMAGNLYGTASLGGAHNGGTIFELSPNAGRTAWSLKVLYSFCAKTNCADGDGPVAGLTYAGAAAGKPYDGVSTLFGTTPSGGRGRVSLPYDGTAFELKRSAAVWREYVIHSFCTRYRGGNCLDGNYPQAPLIVDSSGNLFGTTESGGVPPHNETYYGGGTVFEIGNGTGKWVETVLYSFCTVNLGRCADGSAPYAGLALDGSGNLEGLTYYGGTVRLHKDATFACCGVVFKVVPNGTASTETVLDTLCANAACRHGANPSASPIVDSRGNLYGTTLFGGDSTNASGGAGIIFELRGSALAVLHEFCSAPGCPDGENPSGIVSGGSRHYYGTTKLGGAANKGVVWELTL